VAPVDHQIASKALKWRGVIVGRIGEGRRSESLKPFAEQPGQTCLVAQRIPFPESKGRDIRAFVVVDRVRDGDAPCLPLALISTQRASWRRDRTGRIARRIYRDRCSGRLDNGLRVRRSRHASKAGMVLKSWKLLLTGLEGIET